MQDNEVNQILEEVCERHNVPAALMEEMLKEERSIRHLKMRRGVTERLRLMIEKSLGVGA